MRALAGVAGSMMSDILSLIPKSWLVSAGAALLLVIVIVGGACAWQGYEAGFDKARAEGAASLAAERRDRAEENAARALAVADAERAARVKLEQAVARSTLLDRELRATRDQLAAERKRFNQRIANAAQAAAATCTGLPAEWVRLYNDELGSGGEPPDASGLPSLSVGASGASPGAVSRVSPDASLTTPADILAHARDYGGYCRDMKAQLNALIDAVEGGQ